MSKTKHCKGCGDPLTKKNRYPGNGKSGRKLLCKDCYKLETNEKRNSRNTFKTIYIERGRYPRTKVAQKLLKTDIPYWDQVRTLSTSPRSRIEFVESGVHHVVWMDSEFEEWHKGRQFFTSGLGGRYAREGYITKTGTRAGSDTYVFEDGQKVGTKYQHAVCTECGHDEVRYDERGFKYCTKCFVIQEAQNHLSIANYEPSLHEEPEVCDPIFQIWYRKDDAKAVGVR